MDPRLPPSCSTPFEVGALICRGTGADYIQKTFKYVPSGYDPIIPRFTQDNLITKGQKTRAQVLGEPVTINGKQIQDFGYQVRQLDEMLRANGLTTRLVIDSKPEQDIRTDLVAKFGHRERIRSAVVQIGTRSGNTGTPMRRRSSRQRAAW